MFQVPARASSRQFYVILVCVCLAVGTPSISTSSKNFIQSGTILKSNGAPDEDTDSRSRDLPDIPRQARRLASVLDFQASEFAAKHGCVCGPIVDRSSRRMLDPNSSVYMIPSVESLGGVAPYSFSAWGGKRESTSPWGRYSKTEGQTVGMGDQDDPASDDVRESDSTEDENKMSVPDGLRDLPNPPSTSKKSREEIIPGFNVTGRGSPSSYTLDRGHVFGAWGGKRSNGGFGNWGGKRSPNGGFGNWGGRKRSQLNGGFGNWGG